MSIGLCLNEAYPECRSEGYTYKRRSNLHHLYFPARDYTTDLEKAFRDMEINKVQMCICAHNLLHEFCEPPVKPSVSEMCLALTVDFACVNT